MPEAPFAPVTPAELRRLRDELDAQGRRLVFTNGCFDILHTGHVRYLQHARALGDALVVALNNDASVRALKGPTRPINSELDRAEVLAALRCVDHVTLFAEPRVTALIDTIRPHIYAKGGDYTPETLDPGEKAALDRVGSAIHILPLVPGRSTTSMITRMQTPETPPLRLAVLGSGQGSNLDALLAAINTGSLNASIVLALSDQPDSPFLQLADRHGIPTQTVDCGPHPLRTTTSAQQTIHDYLLSYDAQVVVLAGFMRILKNPTLSTYADRIVNVHPSLLPEFKGRDAVHQALAAGVAKSGCSVHLVTASIDSGRILGQAEVSILPGDTEATLHARIKAEEHRLLPRVLNDWRNLGLPTGS